MQEPAQTQQTPFEAYSARVPRRHGHLRLILFFVAIALACAAVGVQLLGDAQSHGQRATILALSVATASALGLGGVLYHRFRMIHQRWVESQKFLTHIRRESAKYRALLEGAADMLVLVDPDGRVREQNAIARRALGLSARSGEDGAHLDGIVVAEDLGRLSAALETALADPGVPVAQSELRVMGEAGEQLVVDARVVAIDLEDSRVLLLSLRDLTARKQMEHQLLVRERLSSLGLLTAGVAHEINNPLEGIGNYLALLGRDGLAQEQRTRYIEAVGHGFARIRDIARDLLRFARPSREGGRRADLVGVVERALSLVRLSRTLSGIEIATEGLAEPLFVEGDAGQLEQVVVNLLINAATATSADAGRGGGAVTLRARTLQDATGTRVVELDVEDDGPGIPERDLARIFDPFFSSTGGTGLGLAVSYGIVSAHAGGIRVRNVEGRGACFTIVLPLSPSEPAPPTEATYQGAMREG